MATHSKFPSELVNIPFKRGKGTRNSLDMRCEFGPGEMKSRAVLSSELDLEILVLNYYVSGWKLVVKRPRFGPWRPG